MKEGYVKAMLIGGLIAGFLNVIPVLNCCCCLWTILGGVIGSYIYVNSARQWPTDGDGVVIGVGAGVISGVMYGFYTLAMRLVFTPETMMRIMDQILVNMPPEAAEQFRQAMEQQYQTGIAATLVSIVIYLVVIMGVSALGGYLGMTYFRPKRFGPRPPGAPMAPGGYYPGGPAGPGMPGQGYGYPGQGGPPPAQYGGAPGAGYGQAPPPQWGQQPAPVAPLAPMAPPPQQAAPSPQPATPAPPPQPAAPAAPPMAPAPPTQPAAPAPAPQRAEPAEGPKPSGGGSDDDDIFKPPTGG